MPINTRDLIFPAPLQAGDRVAIVSPASAVNSDYIDGAVSTLIRWGYEPVVAPHARGISGSYSGTVSDRAADLANALADPSIRAVICSRGGYGTVHLLDDMARLPLRDDPKWVVGFSDISALHALMATHDIASIHGSMCKHLTLQPDGLPATTLRSILRGDRPSYHHPSHPLNRPGTATGRLAGGNMAVLGGLIGTRFDMIRPGTVLFIEDIAEPIYKVERLLYQLRLSGVLPAIAGLIVGRFTDWRPDRNYTDIYTMIADMVTPYGYPVAFDFPIGHVDDNMPVIVSSTVTLSVSDDGARMYSHPM
ncbi:MAG: LD-carboxypeptidase [Pseudoflavonifractor sp.]|nr:LD-carboxypeptidase [Pseudoflavonifractor sp.]